MLIVYLDRLLNSRFLTMGHVNSLKSYHVSSRKSHGATLVTVEYEPSLEGHLS